MPPQNSVVVPRIRFIRSRIDKMEDELEAVRVLIKSGKVAEDVRALLTDKHTRLVNAILQMRACNWHENN